MHLNIINTTDMEEAARLLNSYNLTYAIIGTEKTAEIYNLNILNPNINNDKSNESPKNDQKINNSQDKSPIKTNDNNKIKFLSISEQDPDNNIINSNNIF